MAVSRRYRRDLPEVPAARQFAAEVVQQDGAVPTDDLLLVVSELVTNAVKHGAGAIELRVDVARRHACVEVLDEGGQPIPEPGHPVPEATGGRGLHLVRSVSEAWGSGFDRYGRTLVWAEVPEGRRRDAGEGPNGFRRASVA
jgi:anti-sigma regulatory factor (Ser/Thr protein kinase)